MGFSDDVRSALSSLIGPGKPFANRKRMADSLEVDPSQLNRFLKGDRGLTVDSLGHILDKLRVELCFPHQDRTTREVCFVDPKPVATDARVSPAVAEDYVAVPLAAGPVAAGPGLIPEDAMDGWILVWREHEAVRHRDNLIAVRVGPREMSMVPALHPGDIVLVDRSDTSPEPAGRIMLVTDPEGAAMIKRVAVSRVDSDTEFVFYSDNSREYPPQTHRLKRDYGGDPTRAIVGRVVWAWSDMTRK